MTRTPNLARYSLQLISVIAMSAALSTTALAASNTGEYGTYTGPAITFSQIYANPDDQQLNLDYARQQAAEGDLISAAAALERMLFSQPDWDSARLFYALILYKLDDRQAALRELDALTGRPLTPSQRQQANAYRNSFTAPARQASASAFSGRIAVGVRYDDNAGNALSDNLITVTNQSDTSLLAQGQLRYSKPIGENGLKFNASVFGQGRLHDTFDRANYATYGGSAGFSGPVLGGVTFKAEGRLLQVDISGDKYLEQAGAHLRFSKDISPSTSVWASAGYHDQSYNDLTFTVGETARSGDRTQLRFGVNHEFPNGSTLGAHVGYVDKTATNQDFAYDGIRLGVHGYTNFNNGLYVRGNVNYRDISYKGVTPRDDDHINVRVASGASLNSLGSVFGMEKVRAMDNLFAEFALIYTDRSSTDPAVDYDNFGTELKLIWEF